MNLNDAVWIVPSANWTYSRRQLPAQAVCVGCERNLLFLVGVTHSAMGGSHFHLVQGLEGGEPPRVDPEW